MTAARTDTATVIASALAQANAAVAAADGRAAAAVFETLQALDWTAAGPWTTPLVRDALQAALAAHLVIADDQALARLLERGLALYEATDASFSDQIMVCYNLQALYGQRGDNTRRNAVASRAVQLAAKYDGALTNNALSALLSLIDVFFAAHQFEAVAHLYRPVVAWACAAPHMTQSTRVALLARSGNAFAAIGQYDASLAAFSVAAQFLDGVDAPGESWRVDVLTGQASAAARCGQTELASQAYDAALEALSSVSEARDSLRETLYFNAAVFWLDSEQFERAADAQRLLIRSQQLCAARLSTDSVEYTLGLVELARAAHAHRRFADAVDYLYQAAGTLNALEQHPADPRMLAVLAGASRTLAQSLFEAERFEPAGDAWFLALRSQWQAAGGNGALR